MDRIDNTNHLHIIQDNSVMDLYDSVAYNNNIREQVRFLDISKSRTLKILHARADRLLVDNAAYDAYLGHYTGFVKSINSLRLLMAAHAPVTMLDSSYFEKTHAELDRKCNAGLISKKQYEEEMNKLASTFVSSITTANQTNLANARTYGIEQVKSAASTPNKNK